MTTLNAGELSETDEAVLAIEINHLVMAKDNVKKNVLAPIHVRLTEEFIKGLA